jgi:two-component system, OmpR family, sensor histidine kinase KdpD
MDSVRRRWPVMPAYVAVPVGAGLLLCVGAVTAGSSGRVSGSAVAVVCGCVVFALAASSDPKAAAPIGAIAWMTGSAFAGAPYGRLHPSARQAVAAVVLTAAGALSGLLLGAAGRSLTRAPQERTLEPVTRLAAFASAVDRRRQFVGWALAAATLPPLTVVLTACRAQLSLTDNLLIYLLAVVAVAVVGGFWPAVFAAIGASLLINWYFTPPYHTFTIAEPDNLLALLLFIVVAISVSSVVHLAARRLLQARRSAGEAEALARLARSVLGADDTPTVVLQHLHATLAVGAELLEQTGDRWLRVACSGDIVTDKRHRIVARDDVVLVVYGDLPDDSHRLLQAAASQAAAALDRDRLRTQAAQAEALAAGNRMRTALLAAVSHDLRTPLASIKAGISSLRQSDVRWSPEDEAILLATIEESSDRLDSLIANLLDMSRVQTGALQPYLRPAAVDEIAPLALLGIAGAGGVRLDVPETLPLVMTDAGLLERALANLVANALRYSPPDQPPALVADVRDGRVCIAVVDHGPGVAAEDWDRIFDPFQRLGDQDSTTGIGLGLAVARGFVEAVGGRLRPSQTPDGGLTMTITLPVTAARTTERPQVES